jgi:hypothetical protein
MTDKEQILGEETKQEKVVGELESELTASGWIQTGENGDKWYHPTETDTKTYDILSAAVYEFKYRTKRRESTEFEKENNNLKEEIGLLQKELEGTRKELLERYKGKEAVWDEKTDRILEKVKTVENPPKKISFPDFPAVKFPNWEVQEEEEQNEKQTDKVLIKATGRSYPETDINKRVDTLFATVEPLTMAIKSVNEKIEEMEEMIGNDLNELAKRIERADERINERINGLLVTTNMKRLKSLEAWAETVAEVLRELGSINPKDEQ